ncbi:MAG: leucyl/phenylalanyl-tRNA--protein transferase [Candidatus Kapabacteria bacterium]|nr:leucyl/phenylalanyl-tRNA--protein transferase [Candidatus Kapabacteria bacterium]
MQSGGPNIILPEVLIVGYRNGFFPMGDSVTGRVLWHRPDPRAIIPLDAITIPRSLRQTLRKAPYTITVNACFEDVIAACADRNDTWIAEDVIDAYTELHRLGIAHSMEAWKGDDLVGGLYGVAIGGAFFGESMFSRQRDASKVTFAHLAYRLNNRGFRLLDTQYINDFTASLGAVEIPDAEYQTLLAAALAIPAEFV